MAQENVEVAQEAIAGYGAPSCSRFAAVAWPGSASIRRHGRPSKLSGSRSREVAGGLQAGGLEGLGA
jgi:hypothetical protein